MHPTTERIEIDLVSPTTPKQWKITVTWGGKIVFTSTGHNTSALALYDYQLWERQELVMSKGRRTRHHDAPVSVPVESDPTPLFPAFANA